MTRRGNTIGSGAGVGTGRRIGASVATESLVFFCIGKQEKAGKPVQ